MCVAVALMPAAKVWATDVEEEAKKAYELPVQSNEIENWPQGPAVYGQSAIVIDADTRSILYAKNMHDKHYPASITKDADQHFWPLKNWESKYGPGDVFPGKV